MFNNCNVSWTASSVPLHMIHDQDDDFMDKIEEIGCIYFGNLEINQIDDYSMT